MADKDPVRIPAEQPSEDAHWRDLMRVPATEQASEADIRDADLATLRRMLKTKLRYQFGHQLAGLPKKLQTQIDAADDAEQLRQAIRRVPDCASLADFQ